MLAVKCKLTDTVKKAQEQKSGGNVCVGSLSFPWEPQ